MEKWKIYNIFNEEKSMVAGTTTKNLEKNFFYSLAVHTNEDLKKIWQNREEFMKSFPDNFKFVSQFQVHSNRVINIDKYELNSRWTDLKLDADGFVTTKKGVILNILTADCLALLAYDPKNRVVGAAHAGWRGTKDEIAKNLIKSMVNLGANIKDIKVALSPSIKACCYEVGQEVAKHFFDYKDALVKTSKDKWHLDISIVNYKQLLKEGINEKNIEVSQYCTSCSSDIYFSYRKEGGCSGRFISFIGMV